MTDAPADSRPREWWVKEHRIGRNISNSVDLFTAVIDKPQNPGWIHVIEKSAYDALAAERDAALEALGAKTKEWANSFIERDQLKAELKIWQMSAGAGKNFDGCTWFKVESPPTLKKLWICKECAKYFSESDASEYVTFQSIVAERDAARSDTFYKACTGLAEKNARLRRELADALDCLGCDIAEKKLARAMAALKECAERLPRYFPEVYDKIRADFPELFKGDE